MGAVNHTCHAMGCSTPCKPEMLFCYKHWKMTPRTIQAEVYLHYQPGQCQLAPPPSSKWHHAADKAIAAVAVAEGRMTEDAAREWVATRHQRLIDRDGLRAVRAARPSAELNLAPEIE